MKKTVAVQLSLLLLIISLTLVFPRCGSAFPRSPKSASQTTSLTRTSETLPLGTQGSTYKANLQAAGGVSPYKRSIAAGFLPSGLILQSSKGTLGGIPTTMGTYGITFAVKDNLGNSSKQTLSLTIDSGNLVIVTTALAGGMLTQAYSAQLQASGGVTPYAWSVQAGTLPPGLVLTSGGGISGTPSQAGSYAATFGVQDNLGQTASQNLSITIASTSLAILTTSLPDGTLSKSYSAQLQASGGGTPYTWSIIGGVLPSGLSLSTGGLISGTPTATGSFGATFQVSDSTLTGAQTAMTNLSIVVVAALQITTATLSGATVGTAYSAQLAATGGSSPYTWTLASGALPPGLSLASSGAISGTPDTAGTSSFTAEVKDSAGGTAQKALSISASSATPGQSTYYGVPWNANGLSNTPIGRSYNRMADYRFQASHSGSATGVRLYLAFAKISTDCTYSGYYAGGTGGQILIQLQTDDGTTNHFPSGTVLASYLITDPLACNPGTSSCTNSQRFYTFDTPASLTAGTLYHLVFSNVDPNESCNWTSVDNLYIPVNTPNIQPAVSDADFAELIKDTSNWAVNYSTTPIMDLVYADGTHFGQGFIYKGSNFEIQGSSQVRETFTVGGNSVTFSRAFIRLQPVGSPGLASVTITTSTGAVVASGPVGSIDSKGWGAVDFGSNFTLAAGQAYLFVVSAPADSANYYSTWPLQAGTAYGFNPPNVFPDGYFQYTTDGSTWHGYNGSRTDFDLQFYVAP